jgi:quercetin dioxygenase-like cupin family protein
MNEVDQERRTVLCGLEGLAIGQQLAQDVVLTQASSPQGYVFGAGEGEHLIHFRDHGQIVIKTGSAIGFDNLAFGTQQVMAGAGIPIHRHLKMNEAFYVLEGSGVFILNDVRHSFEKGGAIFIPNNSWHGFVNPDQELLLLWIISPAGLDGFFRETCSPQANRQSNSLGSRSRRSPSDMRRNFDD